jgi:hypothetical protein
VLDAGFGHYLPPGQVAQRNLLQPTGIDRDRVLEWGRSDLVRDRQHGIEAVRPREVDVPSDLIDDDAKLSIPETNRISV